MTTSEYSIEVFEEAEEILRVASALGYTPPLFPGGKIYSPVIYRVDKGFILPNEELGFYATYEDATIAVRNWVVEKCRSLDVPCHISQRIPQCDTAGNLIEPLTTEELIARYFDVAEDTYEVEILHISPKLTPQG